ncbi:MAG: LacI family DNA-binding transcriptional regulator [Pleomorphochaeta sp.]
MGAKITDVAKKAGVSISTVSRVLNGQAKVSPSLKKKVLSVVKELEYQPSQAARSLASRKSTLIGVIVPDLSYDYYSTMISTIEEEASKNGYNIIVCSIQEDLAKEIKYLKLFNEMYICGLILMHEKVNSKILELLNNCTFPVIQASIMIKGYNSININIDDYKAAYEAVKYLINNGHKDIAMIGSVNKDTTSGFLRHKGYCDALKDNNLQVHNSFFKIGDFSYESGYQNAKELFSLKNRPTAIFAASDTMAIGALNAAMDNGFSVPDDISILGFDNIFLSSIFRPALSTIAQPAKLIGKLAVASIINDKPEYIIDNKKYDLKDNKIIVPYSIIKRSSVKEIN